MDFLNMVGGRGYGWGFVGPVMILLAVWTLFWKGLALWHSSQKKQGWWFIILLVLNTVGILEIIYLFAVIKLQASELIPKAARVPASAPASSPEQQPK